MRLPPERPDANVPMRAGDNIDKCSVGLRFFGDDLDPDVVSATLGAEPTTACRKGDVARGRGHDRMEPQGKWLLTLEFQDGLSLEDLINRLLDQLSDDLAVWHKLSSAYRADLFCGLQLHFWNSSLVVSPLTLRRIGDRGLELGLDIYYVGENDLPEQT
jgi:hypothetical protein